MILDTRFTCNCIYSVFFRQLLFLNKYFYTQILANYARFFSLLFHRTVLSAIEQPFKSKLAFTSSIVCRKHIMANVKFTITFHMNFKWICRNNSRFIVRSKNPRYCSIIFELSIRNIFVHLKLLKFWINSSTILLFSYEI